ncbi:MAG: hypothetical protein JWP03_1653 [Phycisphaerales bacterium]|jgi:hypothetical protein|nr:hypothetical protein [Phycisphaerales bacterium]
MRLSRVSLRSTVLGMALAGGITGAGLIGNMSSGPRTANAAEPRKADTDRLRDVYHDLEKQRDILKEMGKSGEAQDANRHRLAAAEHLTMAMQEIKLEIGEFNDDKPRDRK